MLEYRGVRLLRFHCTDFVPPLRYVLCKFHCMYKVACPGQRNTAKNKHRNMYTYVHAYVHVYVHAYTRTVYFKGGGKGR